MACRVTARGVEPFVPGWLLNSAAPYAALRYLSSAASLMAQEPDRFGFDPANSYTVVVQTWDRALADVPSVAFGRSSAGQPLVKLVPDVYYIHHDGYAGLRAAAEHLPAWRHRKQAVAWRGSVTGSGPYSSPGEIPRVALALSCRSLPRLDVALFGVHPTMQGIYDVATIEQFIAANGLVGERWPMLHFGTFQHVLDIDGHANAWAFLEKLILGCCVLKVDSPYEQWFYDRVTPWVHYIPIRNDLADLSARIEWCLEHPDRCEEIAANGRRFAASTTYLEEVSRSCPTLLELASIRRAG